MDFGVFTLGDHLPDPHLGCHNESQADMHHGWVREGVLAEQCNYASVWLGEHHFNEYILTVPQMLLTAIASRTDHIRLGTAVTLLANHDPVRIAEDFATLDLLSNGRAEIGIAPGITPATFRLFDQNPDEAQEMLFEKLDLLIRLWSEDDVDAYRTAYISAGHDPADMEVAAIAILDANNAIGGIDHLLCYFDAGGMPQTMVENSIRQFGERVIPAVQQELA